jgi:hypothetical protein
MNGDLGAHAWSAKPQVTVHAPNSGAVQGQGAGVDAVAQPTGVQQAPDDHFRDGITAAVARASARIIRMNHSHKISAYPIRTSIRTRTRARMWHHGNRMHWALPATSVVTAPVKWDKA